VVETAASGARSVREGLKLTAIRRVCYCHTVLTLPLLAQSYRVRPGIFGSYWWWYAHAGGAVR